MGYSIRRQPVRPRPGFDRQRQVARFHGGDIHAADPIPAEPVGPHVHHLAQFAPYAVPHLLQCQLVAGKNKQVPKMVAVRTQSMRLLRYQVGQNRVQVHGLRGRHCLIVKHMPPCLQQVGEELGQVSVEHAGTSSNSFGARLRPVFSLPTSTPKVVAKCRNPSTHGRCSLLLRWGP